MTIRESDRSFVSKDKTTTNLKGMSKVTTMDTIGKHIASGNFYKRTLLDDCGVLPNELNTTMIKY